ncbi:hypothetical protein PFISCL1PPCAC_27860, partial [Pristionchus fissidentatus]
REPIEACEEVAVGTSKGRKRRYTARGTKKASKTATKEVDPNLFADVDRIRITDENRDYWLKPVNVI